MLSRMTNQSHLSMVMRDNQTNLARVAEIQNQLASGKRIQKMSDDPGSGRRSLVFRHDRFQSQTWATNIQHSLDFTSFTDSALNEMTAVFTAVKQAAVQGASDDLDGPGRAALAANITSQLQRLVDLGNTVGDGRFIFGGTEVNTPPFTISADGSRVDYHGNLDSIAVEIGPNSRLDINENGHQLFQSGQDIFSTVIKLRDALAANDPKVVGDLITEVDASADHITNLHGALGGRVQRLEQTQRQLESIDSTLASYISREEDVDLPAAIMELQSAQVALEAGLQVGARTLQPTLLDYL